MSEEHTPKIPGSLAGIGKHGEDLRPHEREQYFRLVERHASATVEPVDVKLSPAQFGVDLTLYIVTASAAATGAEGEMGLGFLAEIAVEHDEPPTRALLALNRMIDPYKLAGDLMGAADAMLRRTAIDGGLDRIEQEGAIRLKRRQAAIARRQLAAELAKPELSTCGFCDRSFAFVVDGVRYCKRHAEEYGVRPHGKIGGES